MNTELDRQSTRRPEDRLRIIAHRCKGFGEEENSLAALRKALASRVDEVELDLRLTKDRKLVAAHKPWYRGPDGALHLVARETAAQAQAQGMMTCTEMLSEFAASGGGKRLRIELKNRAEEEQVLSAVNDAGLTSRVVLVSWHPAVLCRLRRRAPGISLSYSFLAGLYPFGLPSRVPKVIEDRRLRLESANIVSFPFSVPAKLIAGIRAAGTDAIAVGCASREEAEVLRQRGLWGVLTDCAEKLLAS